MPRIADFAFDMQQHRLFFNGYLNGYLTLAGGGVTKKKTTRLSTPTAGVRLGRTLEKALLFRGRVSCSVRGSRHSLFSLNHFQNFNVSNPLASFESRMFRFFGAGRGRGRDDSLETSTAALCFGRPAGKERVHTAACSSACRSLLGLTVESALSCLFVCLRCCSQEEEQQEEAVEEDKEQYEELEQA